MSCTPRIAVTCGEPAGIGYELVAAAACSQQKAEIVAIGDPDLLRQRSQVYSCPAQELELFPWQSQNPPCGHTAGRLPVDGVELATPAQAGVLNPANSPAVIKTLQRAVNLTLDNQVDAIVTAPVHKGVINEAGIPFTGHTEMLAELFGTANPVMMLVAKGLRVALATTHLPLREVPDAITDELLECVITTLHHDLVDKFAIAAPRIVVTGINPHAGEGGHLGSEEIDTIIPVLERLRGAGMNLTGPVPADTAFIPAALEGTDAVLTMYHDQGLPVLKRTGFGHAVNVTLGLPIVRTSVDHGTALELAGSGRADCGSLQSAIDLAAELAIRRQHRPT
ncbi:4-hydroxythreonine-4-phosphate dehydrogenase PdxA [Halorhodospira halochloris]|uniref:4-hydroxythreonine-4-phosphate dehydrogenase PdxA n=1 Tax=Halorhodospira halochloris TaxID=1052 RepID=UPI001EE7D518|nr:4-hydroxythreonine-4-phosphate dehydrogenase PdxA [Halorhodospira halochloris]MCG5529348.1 4-hydroxythreonine-4-phosphate dehydrogenase PdxA [Halorhodospira halochloris]